MNSISKIQLVTMNNLVHDVYAADSALAVEHIVLTQLKALIAYDAGDFYLASPNDDMQLTSPVTENLSMAYAQAYLDSYQTQDYARGMFTGHSNVFRESDIIPNAEMVQTAYYRKFYQGYDFTYSLHLAIGFNHRFLGVVSLYRRRGPDFSYNDIETLNLLNVHLEERLYRDFAAAQAHLGQYTMATLAAQYQLTRREVSVAKALLSDATNAEISDQLAITTNTLKKHIANIYHKVQITNRIQLIHLVRQT